MIEYSYQSGAKPTIVRLDGKLVGRIKSVEGGFQYFPKGSKTGGEIFPHIKDVQKSLGE